MEWGRWGETPSTPVWMRLNAASLPIYPHGDPGLSIMFHLFSSFDFLFFASFHLGNRASWNDPSGGVVGMRSSSKIYPYGFIYLIIFLVIGHPSDRAKDKYKTCPVILLAVWNLEVANLDDIRKKKKKVRTFRKSNDDLHSLVEIQGKVGSRDLYANAIKSEFQDLGRTVLCGWSSVHLPVKWVC